MPRTQGGEYQVIKILFSIFDILIDFRKAVDAATYFTSLRCYW